MLHDFIHSNLPEIVTIQKSFSRDAQFVNAVRIGEIPVDLVRGWMYDYSLLRGTNQETVFEICNAYIEFC